MVGFKATNQRNKTKKQNILFFKGNKIGSAI